MSICPARNLIFKAILISSILVKPSEHNPFVTTTDDPSNVDVDIADAVDLERFQEQKKNRPVSFQRNRIVGGNATSIEKHPFIVSLQMRDGSHMCGATLILESWALCASHCITIGMECILRDPTEYIIVAGLSDVTRIMDYGQIREIDAFIKHPRFSRPLLLNDISLIKLKNPMILKETVQLVKLPDFHIGQPDLSDRFDECTALGWGAQRPRSGKPYEQLSEQEKLEIEEDTVAPILRQVNLPVISTDNCKDIISDDYITNRHVCTMYPYGGKDACEGDSGGPLMCDDLQHGITSWGHGCALPGTPGVFTRVETFKEWISNVIEHGNNFDPYNFSNKVMYSNLLFISVLLSINELLCYLLL